MGTALLQGAADAHGISAPSPFPDLAFLSSEQPVQPPMVALCSLMCKVHGQGSVHNRRSTNMSSFYSLLTHNINSLLAEKRVAVFRVFLRPCGILGSVLPLNTDECRLRSCLALHFDTLLSV